MKLYFLLPLTVMFNLFSSTQQLSTPIAAFDIKIFVDQIPKEKISPGFSWKLFTNSLTLMSRQNEMYEEGKRLAETIEGAYNVTHQMLVNLKMDESLVDDIAPLGIKPELREECKTLQSLQLSSLIAVTPHDPKHQKAFCDLLGKNNGLLNSFAQWILVPYTKEFNETFKDQSQDYVISKENANCYIARDNYLKPSYLKTIRAAADANQEEKNRRIIIFSTTVPKADKKELEVYNKELIDTYNIELYHYSSMDDVKAKLGLIEKKTETIDRSSECS